MSSLQYDSTMKPLMHVTVDTNLSSLACYDDIVNDCLAPSARELEFNFQVEWANACKQECVASGKVVESERLNLRRRKGDEPIENSDQDVPREGKDGSSEELLKDPLIWFGVLVPPSLRHSQQMFKKGMYITYIAGKIPHHFNSSSKGSIYSVCNEILTDFSDILLHAVHVVHAVRWKVNSFPPHNKYTLDSLLAL